MDASAIGHHGKEYGSCQEKETENPQHYSIQGMGKNLRKESWRWLWIMLPLTVVEPCWYKWYGLDGSLERVGWAMEHFTVLIRSSTFHCSRSPLALCPSFARCLPCTRISSPPIPSTTCSAICSGKNATWARILLCKNVSTSCNWYVTISSQYLCWAEGNIAQCSWSHQ